MPWASAPAAAAGVAAARRLPGRLVPSGHRLLVPGRPCALPCHSPSTRRRVLGARAGRAAARAPRQARFAEQLNRLLVPLVRARAMATCFERFYGCRKALIRRFYALSLTRARSRAHPGRPAAARSLALLRPVGVRMNAEAPALQLEPLLALLSARSRQTCRAGRGRTACRCALGARAARSAARLPSAPGQGAARAPGRARLRARRRRRDATPAELPLLVELLHAGSLIVDDIEDGSRARRGAARAAPAARRRRSRSTPATGSTSGRRPCCRACRCRPTLGLLRHERITECLCAATRARRSISPCASPSSRSAEVPSVVRAIDARSRPASLSVSRPRSARIAARAGERRIDALARFGARARRRPADARRLERRAQPDSARQGGEDLRTAGRPGRGPFSPRTWTRRATRPSSSCARRARRCRARAADRVLPFPARDDWPRRVRRHFEDGLAVLQQALGDAGWSEAVRAQLGRLERGFLEAQVKRRAAVVGSGFGGLAVAIRLQGAGIRDRAVRGARQAGRPRLRLPGPRLHLRRRADRDHRAALPRGAVRSWPGGEWPTTSSSCRSRRSIACSGTTATLRLRRRSALTMVAQIGARARATPRATCVRRLRRSASSRRATTSSRRTPFLRFARHGAGRAAT